MPFFNKKKIKRKNTFYSKKALLLRSKIICTGKNNSIMLHEGVILYKTTIIISGDNNTVIIGKNSVIKYANLNIEDSENEIVLGEKVHMCGSINIACLEGSKVEIGDECLFSSEIEIRTSDSHSIFDESGNRINTPKNVKIGHHVWCGQRVFILKGSVVGNDSVIGAGSLVNKAYAINNCILAGSPAKVVKENIIWDKERTLNLEQKGK